MTFQFNDEYLTSLGYPQLDFNDISQNTTLLLTLYLSFFVSVPVQLTQFANLTTVCESMYRTRYVANSTHTAMLVPLNDTHGIPIATYPGTEHWNKPIDHQFDSPVEFDFSYLSRNNIPLNDCRSPKLKILGFMSGIRDAARVIYAHLNTSKPISLDLIDYNDRFRKYALASKDGNMFMDKLGLEQTNYTVLSTNDSALINTALASIFSEYGKPTANADLTSVCYTQKLFTNTVPLSIGNSTHMARVGLLNTTHLGTVEIVEALDPAEFYQYEQKLVDGDISNYTTPIPQWLESSPIFSECQTPESSKQSLLEYLHLDEFHTRIAFNSKLKQLETEFSWYFTDFEYFKLELKGKQSGSWVYHMDHLTHVLDCIGTPQLNLTFLEENPRELIRVYLSSLNHAYLNLSVLTNSTNFDNPSTPVFLKNGTHEGKLVQYNSTHSFVPLIRFSNEPPTVNGSIDRVWETPEFITYREISYPGEKNILESISRYLDNEARIAADLSLSFPATSPYYGRLPDLADLRQTYPKCNISYTKFRIQKWIHNVKMYIHNLFT